MMTNLTTSSNSMGHRVEIRLSFVSGVERKNLMKGMVLVALFLRLLTSPATCIVVDYSSEVSLQYHQQSLFDCYCVDNYCMTFSDLSILKVVFHNVWNFLFLVLVLRVFSFLEGKVSWFSGNCGIIDFLRICLLYSDFGWT